ncbi:2Fe-2S iron-sulfur cluster-binding protein [Dactylosporangium sp. CA-092794]|uniref:2Fe-2S iron-sulfur cluster-binding protein n=1 Tax=Dactylosporangium sp. CA-092794 TaxID=3239929 RepID=UPI003D9062ED
MTPALRVPGRGRVVSGETLRFRYDGQDYTGRRGDTLASALLANGVHLVGTSIRYGRPRGIFGAGVEEPNALVQIEQPFGEPMLTATTVELYDGLIARGLRGRGRLSPDPDPARYDAIHAHCDLLVVGAGPAGLLAALTGARAGVRVVLVDDQPTAGGALLGGTETLDDAPAADWAARVVAELAAHPLVRVLPRTTALGYYDGLVLALEKRTDHLGASAPARMSRQRVWRIRARHVIVATGAHERPIAFADNDRPGIMLASAARGYLNRFGVLAGRRVAVFTTNDSAYAAAIDMADAGARVAAVIDARAAAPAAWVVQCRRRGIETRPGQVVIGTTGRTRITDAHVVGWADGKPSGPRDGVACDLLLVSGGWNPAAHLFSHAGGALRYDPAIGALVPSGPRPTVRAAGAANGVFTLYGCLRDGAEAARAALSALGRGGREATLPAAPPSGPGAPAQVLWSVPDPDDEAWGATAFVDLQRDATVADVLRAAGAGMRSIEHVKRYTTIGTAHDQGKTSGMLSTGVLARFLGVDVAELGATTFRPPYMPVAFAALAGRDRGQLFDPVRSGPLQAWHTARGAVLQDAGQWRRPRYYPRPGEDMPAATARECRAVREQVGLTDGSTLGKIAVHGPDAAVLLDLMYTNLISSLKVGCIRYGVMCGLDGVVIDDGTVARIAEHEYLLTTTTGGAAHVLDWMQEWSQTEWPHLRVSLTAVTEHWATFPLAGPRSRDVLAAVAPGLALSNGAFPHMTWRDAEVVGVPARLSRISFSGELAYEVSVASWHAQSVWEALLAAGEPFGITPYGLEATLVLRAEKGFPIIGQDSDATTTPHDLGLAWAVSDKKPDFIGRRSFARPENRRPDRKGLVGLLPADPRVLLPEGAQLIATSVVPEPPVPMLGHVTSSYHSAALNRSFALALVRGGSERIGETLYVPVEDTVIPVTVTDRVLYDKENARRDG